MTSLFIKKQIVWGIALLAVILSNPKHLAGNTIRASINNDGQEGNGVSQDGAISDDGRYVVFESLANNLVVGDFNEFYDVFLYETNTNLLHGITIGGNLGGYNPAISADGRYIVFCSHSSNLVPNDTNDEADVFVYDQQTGWFERISVNSNGEQANNGSYLEQDISSDGRYVAFVSSATNLVIGDTNGKRDIFVRDRVSGITEKVSQDSFGNQADYHSGDPVISADGRYVAFESEATNLVANDTNNYADVFLHDRQTGLTQRLSENLNGEGGNHISWEPVISDDGRFVVFYSGASNLVANDTNGAYDVFVADIWLQTLERVSVSSTGEEGNESSTRPGMSADGRFVTFASSANNLIAGDGNEVADIFVRDRWYNLTERVNLTFNNQEATGGNSWSPVISGDGDVVAFTSWATDLVEGDTNEWGDVFVRRVWWPAATISQTVGAVGSYFGLVGSHFPPASTMTIGVNGLLLGSLLTDEEGTVALELNTAVAEPGFYRVRLSVEPYWQEVAFTLTETGVVYPAMGGRPVVDVPAGIALQQYFLPLLFLP